MMAGVQNNSSSNRQTVPALCVAALFATSGVAHFIVPKHFAAIVPSFLPAPKALVFASGAAELACAAGLATRRRWAPMASATLLAVIFPANIQMAVDYWNRGTTPRTLTISRLPFQPLMIWAVLRARKAVKAEG